jgi:hypothetical protein
MLLLGIRQNFPDSYIPIYAPHSIVPLKVSYKYIIFMYIYGWWLINIIFGVEYDWRLMFSTYFGWVYLRYFMVREISMAHGDASPEFALIESFPNCVKPVLRPVFKGCYNVFRNLNLIPDIHEMKVETVLDPNLFMDKKKEMKELSSEFEVLNVKTTP